MGFCGGGLELRSVCRSSIFGWLPKVKAGALLRFACPALLALAIHAAVARTVAAIKLAEFQFAEFQFAVSSSSL